MLEESEREDVPHGVRARVGVGRAALVATRAAVRRRFVRAMVDLDGMVQLLD